MRVGVIRGDVSSPIFLSDLEPTSQVNFPTEPAGQTRYLSRPTSVTVGPIIATLPATLVSNSAIAFPLTINNGNHTLRIKGAAADPYTVVTVANATYANMTALLAALNAALLATPFKAQAFSGTRLTLRTEATGTGAFIAVDSVANGSTFNTPAGLLVGGDTHEMPSAAVCIASTLPIGGPLDVSATNIRATLGKGLTDAQVTAVADLIAPRFLDSNTAIDSFLVGDIKELLSPTYCPDPNRIPAIATGQAVVVVHDDGVTPFSYTLPTLSTAELNAPSAGAVKLTGAFLASAGSPNAEVVATRVKFYTRPEAVSVDQAFIVAAGGKVSATEIIIPASLVPASANATVSVQVQYKSFVSNILTLA